LQEIKCRINATRRRKQEAKLGKGLIPISFYGTDDTEKNKRRKK